MLTLLEYGAFGGSLCSAWLYGQQGYRGPIAGLLTCLLFFAYGYATQTYAAILSNVVFFVIHSRNFINVRKNDMSVIKNKIKEAFDIIVHHSHKASVDNDWWGEPGSIHDPEVNPYVVPAKIALIHSELSEALEGDRQDLMDDKLPHRKMIECELADAVMRIADIAGKLGLDVGGTVAEKMEYNKTRPDHKPGTRRKKY